MFKDVLGKFWQELMHHIYQSYDSSVVDEEVGRGIFLLLQEGNLWECLMQCVSRVAES